MPQSDLVRFRRDGYLVIEDALTPALTEALRAAYTADLGAKVARFGLARANEDASAHQRVLNDFKPKGGNHDINRWNMHLPSRAPYLEPLLFANERVLAIVNALLGEDAVAYLIASDTPYPGSTFQNIHQDFSRFTLALNIALVDFTEENGPIEVYAGTHCEDPRPDGSGFSTAPYAIPPAKMEQIAQRVRGQRLLLRAGSMVLRDHRLMHRGTANVSRAPRPMLSIYYAPPREVPPRWLADASALGAKVLRTVGRGRGAQVQRPALFNLGNVLGRVVEECSLSDRDLRRSIPKDVWASWPAHVQRLLRYARVEGSGATAPASLSGAVHFAKELVTNTRESLRSSLSGTPRRPDSDAEIAQDAAA